MKKIIAVLASSVVLAGLVLALPGSASAGNRKWCKPHREDTKPTATTTNEDNDKLVIKVTNNAYVSSKTVAISNTGFNEQKKNDDGTFLLTGKSEAKAESSNTVNSTVIVVSQN